MSPPHEMKESDGRELDERAVPEVPPILLDSRQWSYVRRRYELTAREVQIAELVCRGLRNDRIARDLKIRPGTVKTHVRNIYRKVKVRSKIAMLLRFVKEARGTAGFQGPLPPMQSID
ncbi:MAG TPA: LuxR C-terminal-related transcriptional regulator [Sedimentisphaerales bacterium]|nr:LuxR C-terminal-related transcriptional regulator [Sedimentisphaerales bacterium]HRS10179.1 LuxR C-terminal-related transcriptional regulator [Sedimentisphaerales bacterium]HRV46885.1 LuxR C-terminal-related transcriptional regulator [Sedimentisphaerales bacterium]